MKKVFLLSPSFQKSVRIKEYADNTYGMGLIYLHAVIENSGYEIITKNYNNTDEIPAEREIFSILSEFKPDYLLIQLFTMNRVSGYRLINAIRKHDKNLKIILGGVHSTIQHEQLLNNFPVDYIVMGEGEITIIELLNALDSNADVLKIKGLAFKNGTEILKTAERELIEDLDSLPFPSHKLFMSKNRKMACILTSRGCPYKCSFCCLHTISKKIYRKRSAGNIIGEIEEIVRNYPNIKIIQILDDTFTLDQQRVIEFCNEVVRRKLNLEFMCSARVKPASREMFEAMDKAGFSTIGFGIETGSKKLLRSIHKNISPDDVIDTFKLLKGTKLQPVPFIMVGFPGESDETVAETINLLRQLRKIKHFELNGFAPLWVYPNTEVCDIMLGKGVISDFFWLTDNDVPYYTIEHTFDELERMGFRILVSTFSLRKKLFFLLKRIPRLFQNPVSLIRKLSKFKYLFKI